MFNIFNEDCFVQMQSIDDDAFDVVLTSPPYNRKRGDKYNDHSDNVDDYFEFLKLSIDECLRVCKGNVFFNIQKNFYNHSDVYKIFGEFSDLIIENIIWSKKNPMPSNGLSVTNSYEFVLVLSKTNKSLKTNSTYVLNHLSTSVFSSNPYKKIHRAVMNPELCQFVFKNFCKEGDTVFDPFMGIGTTGVEAINMGMNFYGIEMSQTYFEIAQNNLTQRKYVGIA